MYRPGIKCAGVTNLELNHFGFFFRTGIIWDINKLDRLALLFFVIALTAASCTKPEEIADTANQRFNQSMDWNNNHSSREIVVQSDDYSIMSIGDSHVGGTINLDRLFNNAKATSASAVVIAGDLTTGHEKDYNAFERVFVSSGFVTCIS